MRSTQTRFISTSRISSFFMPDTHTLFISCPFTWKHPKPFCKSLLHSPVHSLPSLKQQVPEPSRTPPSNSPAYFSPLCHSISPLPSSSPFRQLPLTLRPSLRTRMPSPWNWSLSKSPSYMPSSKYSFPFPDFTPFTKLPSQKQPSAILCLQKPLGQSFSHVPSIKVPLGKLSLPLPLALPSATSPSQTDPSAISRQTFSFSASWPRKNWPFSLVPSSQTTLPPSWGWRSTVGPEQRTPFLSSMDWTAAAMLNGLIFCSVLLTCECSLMGGGAALVCFLGCSIMTDSPKLMPMEMLELSISLPVFFLYSPFLR